MNPSDFTEEEWREFLQKEIINPNPDLFSDGKKRELLTRLTNAQRKIEIDYHELISLVYSDEEIAKLLYAYLDWYPTLQAGSDLLKQLFTQNGLEPIIGDVIGISDALSDAKLDRRNAPSVLAVFMVKEYISVGANGPYKDCPDPPDDDLAKCLYLMVNPEGLKDLYKNTLLEPQVDELYRGAYQIALSRMRDKGYSEKTPLRGDVTVAIKQYVDRQIRSAYRR